MSAISVLKRILTFNQAMECDNSKKWCNAMKEELKSMHDNKVWDLVKLSEGSNQVHYKWVFKTKHDSKDYIKQYKTRLVIKSFTVWALTTTKHSFRFQERILSKLSWFYCLSMIYSFFSLKWMLKLLL